MFARCGLLLLCGLLCLPAVAQAPAGGEKVAANELIDAVDVLLHFAKFQRLTVIGAGDDPVTAKERAALERFIPAILAKNGLPVPTFKVVGNDTYGSELLRMIEQSEAPRYVLAIQSSRYDRQTGIDMIWFEAKLIDRTARKIVWKLSLPWRLVESQPNIRAEATASHLLISMSRSGLIRLPNAVPLDLKGQPIENHTVFASDIE